MAASATRGGGRLGLLVLLCVLLSPPVQCRADGTYDIPAYGGPWAVIHRDNRNSNHAPVPIAGRYEFAYVTRVLQANFNRPIIGPNGHVYFSYMGFSPAGTVLGGHFIGYDGRTGRNTLLLGPPSVDRHVAAANGLIGANGAIYLVDGQYIQRYSPSGSRSWKTQVAGVAPSGPQFSPDGNILLFTWNGWAYLVKPDDGATLMSQNMTPGRTYPAKVPSDCLKRGDSGECAYANTSSVDPVNGRIIQTFNPSSGGHAAVHCYQLDSAPYRLRLLWENSTLEGGTASSPVLSANYERIYVSDRAGNLLALDASTGREIWRFRLGFVAAHSATVSPDGYILPGGSQDDPSSHLTILKDQGDYAEAVFQDTRLRLASSGAVGLDNRFVVFTRHKTTNQLRLSIVDAEAGLIGSAAWDQRSAPPDRITGISLGGQGWVYANTIGSTGLAAFRPVAE